MESSAPKAADEKVIRTAQHIVRTLATSKNAADDMIRILSGFDDRFSDLFPHIDRAGGDPPATGGDREGEPSISAGDRSTVAQIDEVNEDEVEEEEIDVPKGEISEQESLDLDSAEKLVLFWDSTPNSVTPLFESQDDAIQYLTAVDHLLSLSTLPSLSPSLQARVESSLHLSMCRLEDEFRHLIIPSASPSLSSNPSLSSAGSDHHSHHHYHFSLRRSSLSSDTSTQDEPGSPYNPNPNELEHSLSLTLSSDLVASYLIPLELVPDLKGIADRMIRAGFGPELCQVYTDARRESLADCLTALGTDKMSIEEVQKIEWGTLDSKMKKWIHALKTVLKGVLPEERCACDQIFELSVNLKEECFAEAAKGCVLQLLNFGDAIAIGKRTVEKLFRILGMYETLAEVSPDLETLFSGEAREFLKEEAKGILSRLGDAVKGTILEFGNLIRGETSKRALPSGEIHPLTRYVMNYIRLLADYSGSLNSLLDTEDSTNGSDPGLSEVTDMTPLGRCILTLMTYLEANLDDKSKLYEDEALQHIFLMNNLLYIVQKVKDSELKSLLGDNWIRKRRGQIRQHSTAYLRSSWTRVLSFLRDDGLGSSSNAKNALKERFKSFNLAFEEIYRVQTGWRVPDPQLREELKISVSEKVIQAYRAFFGRFRNHLEGGRGASRYVKYMPEDLENHVSDLFEGVPGVPGNPRGKVA